MAATNEHQPTSVASGVSIAISAFRISFARDHFGLTLERRIGREVP